MSQIRNIAITGNIGSGKTTFCRMFEQKIQFEVYYADQIAKQLIDSPHIFNEYVKRWGQQILVDGKISRKLVSNIIFNNEDELRFVNKIIFKQMRNKFIEIMKNPSDKIRVFEVPLLIQSGSVDLFDYKILIQSDEQIQIDRAVSRNVHSRDQIIKRLEYQIPSKYKRVFVDLVIQNNDTLSELRMKFLIFISLLNETKNN